MKRQLVRVALNFLLTDYFVNRFFRARRVSLAIKIDVDLNRN